MSDTPTRYFPTTDYIGSGEYIGDMTRDAEGDWVQYSDYQKLERELAEARKAVEFGAYLAAAAERYLAAVNYASMMCGEDGQVHDADDVVDAEQAMAESARSLRSAIYEFRKRARMRNDERHADNRCVS